VHAADNARVRIALMALANAARIFWVLGTHPPYGS